MKPSRSTIIALGIVVVAGLWLATGLLGGKDEPAAPDQGSGEARSAEHAATQVRVRDVVARDKTAVLSIQGRTRADRVVALRAETAGRAVAVGGKEGLPVAEGTVIVQLAENDRPARVAEARARVQQRRLQFDAARSLEAKSFASRTRLAEAEAELRQAEAQLAAARFDLDHTAISAPFDGVLDHRSVDVGAFVSVGTDVATVLDLDPIVVAMDVSEKAVGGLRTGVPATVRLLDGRVFEGRVDVIAAMANPATRTFRVEVEVPNPDGAIADGLTASVELPRATVAAHRLSPAVLSLSDAGQVGVKIVVDGRARFVPVTIIEDGADAMWVTGLPDRATVITIGQAFVADGTPVEAVPEDDGGRASDQ